MSLEALNASTSGESVEITVYGFPLPLTVTPGQLVLTSDGWKQAVDLGLTDWLAYPIDKETASEAELRALVPAPPRSQARGTSRLTGQSIPVTREALARHLEDGLSYQAIAGLYGRKNRASAYDWALHFGLTRSSHNIMTGDPTADSDFWRVIGYWLAEGDITAGRKDAAPSVARWTFGEKETRYADDVAQVLARYGIPVNVHPVKGASSLTVRCSSQQLATLLGACGKGAHNKGLPTLFQRLPDGHARSLVRGYWAGDGTVTPVGGKMSDGWVRLASVSLSLLAGFSRVLARLDVASSLMRSVTPTQTRYELRFPASSAPWLGIAGRPVVQKTVRISDGLHLTRVKALRMTATAPHQCAAIPHNFAVRSVV